MTAARNLPPGGGECGLCGGPLVKNPHPDAGKPSVLTEVGYVWVCPPCINKAMTGWANRCHAAEGQISRLADFIMHEVPGEPSQSEGAADCAIRLLREHLADTTAGNQPSVE